MKWTISRKLFLAFVLTNVGLVSGIAIAAHFSFQRGFLEYVNRLENSRLNILRDMLADTYLASGSWEPLRHDRELWRDIIREATRRVPGPPREVHDLLRISPRLTVMDAQNRFVAGLREPAPSAERQVITHNGDVLGYLLIRPLKLLTDRQDLEFERRQARMLGLIVLVATAVSLLVSTLLARHLVKPVRHLARATRTLASGRYDERIQPQGRDELGELAGDFNRLAESLERSDHLRRQWMADISHELRTPLAVLNGEIEALQDGVRALDQKALHSLHQEASLLSKLVDDLYQLSLSDLGALSYRKAILNLPELLAQSLASFRSRFEQQDLQLTLESPDKAEEVLVFGDETRLQQLFQNLMQNSLRYTDSPGRLNVSWQKQDAWVELRFDDSAPGVADANLPHLFDRFYRVEASRNRATGGAGLGLAICSNIVDAHEGQIRAEASPLGGLRIVLRLPLATA